MSETTALALRDDPDAALDGLRASLLRSRLTLEGQVLGPDDVGPSVTFHPSAFQKRAKRYVMPEGGTLEDAIDLAGIGKRLRRHLAVYVDDVRIERERWALERPKAGASIFIRTDLQGGDGKDFLRVILTIALVVVSFAVGGWAAGALGFTQGTLAFQGVSALVSATVLTAGQALLNHLIPPPKPSNQFGFDQQPGNPYAAITGLRNQMVPYGPIPRVLGERRLYPMQAARPYTETQGKTQWLRLLLLAGYGPLDISDIKIGNTPIEAFAGAEVEIREGWPDDEPITLFTKNIAEESLAILLNPSAENIRTTDSGTTEVSVDITFPSGLAHYSSEDGKKSNRTVAFTVKYRRSGTADAFVNAQWINGSTAYGTGSNGVITAIAATADATTRSGRFLVPDADDWDIRIERTTDAGGDFDVDDAYWTVLRSIKPDAPVNKTGLCLVALRLKATEQLNGVPDQISVLAKSYLQVWDTETEAWDWQISRNPAWEYVDLLKRRGETQMIADAKIDLPSFIDWASACDATAPNADEPYWECDLVVEQSSLFTALQTVAAHGRAQFALVDGKYSIVRDVEQESPVQHISPRNSRGYRGSKQFVDIPHALRVSFINPDKEDALDERMVYRDGYAAEAGDGVEAAEKVEALDLPGCRSNTRAWREGRYHFGQLLLRPEEHSTSMDIENIRCTKGDLVQFAHHAVSIGLASGRIVGRTTSGDDITDLDLDVSIEMAADATYGMRIRHSDGSSSVHELSAAVGSSIETVSLATPTPIADGPQIGDVFMFGELGLESAPMIVKGIEHAGQFNARLTFVDAQPGIYTADQGEIPAFNSYITNPRPVDQDTPDPPDISVRSDETALLRTRDGVLHERMLIELNKAHGPTTADVRRWEVEIRVNGGNGDWLSVSYGPVHNTVAAVNRVVAGEVWDIRARFITRAGVASDWTEVTGHTVTGKTNAPDPPSSLVVTPKMDGVQISYTASPSIDVAGYEVRVGGVSWGAATKLATIKGASAFFPYSLSGETTFRVKAVDVLGLYSTEVTATVSGNTQPELIRDPFGTDADYWLMSNGFAFSASAHITAHLDAPSGFTCAGAGQGAASSSYFRNNAGHYAPVRKNQTYHFHCDYRLLTGFTGRCQLIARWLDYTGTLISTDTTSGTDYRTVALSASANSAFDFVAKAPATAVSLQLQFFVQWSSTLTNAGNVYAANPNVSRAAVLGSSLVREDGATLISDADAITSQGVASAITGQGALATLSSVKLGATVKRADGVTNISDADAITSLGVASAIASQGALATLSSVKLGATVKRADGVTNISDADAITSLGVASAVTGQGALATLNTVGATQISAGAVLASKLASPGGGNIFPDPDMMDASFYTGDPYVLQAAQSDAGPSTQEIEISANAAQKDVYSGAFRVEASKTYSIAAYGERALTGAMTVELLIAWYSDLAASTLIGSLVSVGTNTTAVPARIVASLAAPSNAKRAKLVFRKQNTSSTASARFSAPFVCRAGDAETVVANTVAAATIQNQGDMATISPLNINSGLSGTFDTTPITTGTSTSISINACTWTGPNGGASISIPSGSITSLSASTKYYVFRDLSGGGSFSATSSASTARARYNDSTGRWLALGIWTTPSSGSGGNPNNPGGSGGGGWIP